MMAVLEFIQDVYNQSVTIDSEFTLQFELIFRCILAAVCGLIIGLERKNRSKEAGIRTHLIVALGSALMMVVSKYGFFDILRYGASLGSEIRLDPSRLASNIITGIGFLGAGTIFIRKQVINGLTTAAGLWSTAGIGMTIGAGMYIVGISITLFQFIIQIILHKNIRGIGASVSDLVLIKAYDSPDVIKQLNDAFEKLKVDVSSIKYEKVSDQIIEIECFVRLPKKYTLPMLASDFKQYDFIKSLET